MSQHTSVVISDQFSAFKPFRALDTCSATGASRSKDIATKTLLRRQMTPQHDIVQGPNPTPDELIKKRSIKLICLESFTWISKAKNLVFRVFCSCRVSKKTDVLPRYHTPVLDIKDKRERWRKSMLKDIRILDIDSIESLISENKEADVYILKSILSKPQHQNTLSKLSPQSKEILRISPSDLDDGTLLKKLNDRGISSPIKNPYNL